MAPDMVLWRQLPTAFCVRRFGLFGGRRGGILASVQPRATARCVDDYELLLIATLVPFAVLVIFKKSTGSAKHAEIAERSTP